MTLILPQNHSQNHAQNHVQLHTQTNLPSDPHTAQAIPGNTFMPQGADALLRAALRLLPRVFGPVAMLVCGLLLWTRVEPGFGAQVHAALSDIAIGAWMLAIGAAAISLWTVGHYDALVHKAAGTGVAPARARRAGRRAIAIGQAAGFGTITGAMVRWRSLPEMGLVDLSKFSVVVSLSFMAAWAVVTGSAALLVWGGLAGLLVIIAAILVVRKLPLPRLPVLPYLRRAHIGGLLIWTLLDTVAAAVVLWAFLPADIVLTPGLFFLAYLVALGAGMISQSPGGLGAFELALIGLLPQADPAALVAAALGYRLVYHIGPAALALLLLVRAPEMPPASDMRLDAAPRAERARHLAPHPDWGLTSQGAALLMAPGKRAGWMIRQAPFTLVGLGPALNRPCVSALALMAQAQGHIALLYKCSGAEAAVARRAGWSVMAVCREAVLDPGSFDLNGPALRQLRRKLRSAEKAGLTVQSPSGSLPLDAMEAVNRDWANAHGGERGFSMGRFDGANVQDQAVILGYQNGRLVGFASFHKTAAGWGLDLMRHTADAPSGTMQALVAGGIDAAKSAGVTHLSLAASLIVPKWPGLLDKALTSQRKSAAGLHQFKSSFGPRWITRYAASPTDARLTFGLACVTWAIHRRRPGLGTDFEFELADLTCDGPLEQASRDIPTLLGHSPVVTRID